MTTINSAIFGERHPTPDQEPAVIAPADGRRVIDAGAGTGKTTTLELRARYLIATGAVRPEELLVVTFTRKAAAEIGERIIRTLDKGREHLEGDPHAVTCCTIHSLAVRILDEFSYACGIAASPRTIADGEASSLFDEVMDEAFRGDLNAPVVALPVFEIKPSELRGALASLILSLKQSGIDPEAFERDGLVAASNLGAQSWGATWSMGKGGKPIGLEPRPERTADERRLEAEREADNVKFAAAVFRRFNERLDEAQVATYDDLLTFATKLIAEHPEVGELLRQRWRYVLIDEFQDTAPSQLAFLREVFGDPDHAERELTNITAVGDFRQSIYGFNGADPGIMRRLTEAAHAVYPLAENRRSHEQIVHAAHAALSASLAGHNVGAAMQAVRGRSEAACVYARTFGETGQPIAARIEHEAAGIAAEIAHLRSQGIASNDIAVLLRKRTHAHRYVRAMAQHGIPVALDRRAGLLEMPEIRDARAWLRLLVDFDRPVALALALVRVLKSPQLSLDDEGLAQVAAVSRQDWAAVVIDGVADDRLDDVVRGRLDQLREWLAVLLSGRSESAPLGVRRLLSTVPLAASYANDAQGEQRLANLRAFEMLAQRFAADAVDPSLVEFVRYLERCVDYEEAVEEADLDVDGVAVMTVHQAKGLEWKVVFIPSADLLHYGDRAVFSPVRRDDRNGALVVSRDVDDRPTLRNVMMKKDYDPRTGECSPADPRKASRAEEEARILYVGLTRACDRLYVSCPTPKRPHPGFLALTGIAEDWPTPRLGDESNGSRVATRPSRVVAQEAIPPPLDLPLVPVVSFTALSTFQTCPRLARYRYRLRLPQLEGLRRRVDGDGGWKDQIDPATFGSLIHRALELRGQSCIDGAAIDYAQALEAALTEYDGVGDGDRARADSVMRHAVQALANLTVLEVETSFEHEVAGTLLSGVIDLIARDGDGVIHVVDYKTGVMVADDHYALQLDLYARATRGRFAGARLSARILRLSEAGAEWRDPAGPPTGELEPLLREAAGFTSDEARPGSHCLICPYNGSPCHAAPSK